MVTVCDEAVASRILLYPGVASERTVRRPWGLPTPPSRNRCDGKRERLRDHPGADGGAAGLV